MIQIVGIGQKENDILLYYTFSKKDKTFFKVITSHDGFTFTDEAKYVIVVDEKQREEKEYIWSKLRFSHQKNGYFLTYSTKKEKSGIVQSGTTDDMIRLKKLGSLVGVTTTAVIVPDYKHRNRYVMYSGEKEISMSYSGDLTRWKFEGNVLLSPRQGMFDEGGLEVGSVFVEKNDIVLFYFAQGKDPRFFAVGVAVFDKKDPKKMLFRSDEPLFTLSEHLHEEGCMPLGIARKQNEAIIYWKIENSSVFSVAVPFPKREGLVQKTFSVIVRKFENNPIISPVTNHPWESRATFNTAAVYEDGKVHFVYRALGDSDLSVLGYATSSDGVTIDGRSDKPIYVPTQPFECPGQKVFTNFNDHFASGGGYGGVEDPRLTKVEDTFYMTYVAFDGCSPPRVALTSIPVDDFLNHRWDSWATPKLISAPGMVNKNAVIFPEKINGKYVVIHRVYPNMLVDYVDDLHFDNYLQGQYIIPPRRGYWDSKKIGAGAPPIKTKDGWLMIYQSVGYQDSGRYKIGAMMLDLNDPTKVLYRSHNPIIEPDKHYENWGHKAGVVYPCGAVVANGTLFIYYGGADTVVCCASEKLDTFLDQLKYNQQPKLRKISSPVLN